MSLIQLGCDENPQEALPRMRVATGFAPSLSKDGRVGSNGKVTVVSESIRSML
jgi:hypothetical protein